MKSITVRVQGGLGNQMHCYAFGRALAVRNRAELILDCEAGYWNDPFGREFMLEMFQETRKHYVPQTVIPVGRRRLFSILLKLKLTVSRMLPISRKLALSETPPFCFKKEIIGTSFVSNPYVLGYWASPRYYEGIENALRRELAPPEPDIPAVHEVLARIRSVRSCFIHWRSYNEDKSSQAGCMRGYYNSAVSLMARKFDDIVFFVFSDDIPGAREQIDGNGHHFVFVDLAETKGNMQSLADFYLMYKCDHAIIGNSTFSWWAAWLAEQKNKVVIAPDGVSPWNGDWVPSEWFLINKKG